MAKLRVLVIAPSFALVLLFIAFVLFTCLVKHLHVENHAFGEVMAFRLAS
jgi:hypothetical protein